MSIAIGTKVKWTSQAAGSHTAKEGVVVGIVPSRTSLAAAIAKAGGGAAGELGDGPKKSHVKAQNTSLVERYLVRVDRDGLCPLWYAPTVGVVERQNS